MDALAAIEDRVIDSKTAIADQRDGGPFETPLEEIRPEQVASEFVERVPIGFARRFAVLGLKPENGIMPVAVASNDALHALDKAVALIGLPAEPVPATESAIQQAINAAYGTRQTPIDAVITDLDGEHAVQAVKNLPSALGDLLDAAGASPVTHLVNLILLDAVKRRASDVHFQPLEDRFLVRLRIDGVLYDYVQPPQMLQEEIVSRIKVMGRMNIAEKRLAQDGRTTVKIGSKTVDLRISSLPTCYGERIVLRLLDKSARLFRLVELGMGDLDLTVFRELIRKSHGILLVSGPTGSGKTTTLYSALQELDHRELNILTLEDPIEYQLPGISQSQVSDKKGMTFATGLRTVLRQDPDVIMVGEIRDYETARMAIQSSLTGHLVLSTLHTNDAAGAVARLLDLGAEPYLVAGSLLGVLAQRLVRRLCPACRVPRRITEAERTLFEVSDTDANCAVFDHGGCEACMDTGYHDRVGVFEILQVNEEIHDLIVAGAKSRMIKAAARRFGMRTLREQAVARFLSGATTAEEVLRVTHSDV